MKKLSQAVENTPIIFNEKLTLPDISLLSTYTKKFFTPNAPELDGAHIHDDYEIYLHISGDSLFLVNNNIYKLERGDVILTRPGDVHFLILNEPSTCEHFCLWFAPSCGKELLQFIDSKDFCAHIAFPIEEREQLISLFLKLTEKSCELNILEKTSVILQIILSLSKTKHGYSKGIQPIPDHMQKIIDYIDNNFQNIQNVASIAQSFNVSAATLNRWFNKYIKISPQEFLKAKKLSYAKKLLDNGASVTQCCMMSGFSDCSYFISVFKQKFGETPHRYQNNI